MFRNLALDALGLCGLALGLCAVGHETALATPTPPACDVVCVNKNYFVKGNGHCAKVIPAACDYCALITPSLCTYLVKTDPSNCVPVSGATVSLFDYPVGSCSQLCSLAATKYTESTAPTGDSTYIADFTLYQCP
jgi:hypothetical protein